MLLGTLGASLLGTLLTGKGILRAISGRPSFSALQNNKQKGILRASSSRSSFSALQNKKGKGMVRAGTGKE